LKLVVVRDQELDAELINVVDPHTEEMPSTGVVRPAPRGLKASRIAKGKTVAAPAAAPRRRGEKRYSHGVRGVAEKVTALPAGTRPG